MRILLVKTSSLGDVVHNLPVVSDLHRHFPETEIDWCVEEAFADIPRLHAAVREVIPVAVRRWRKALGQKRTWQEIGEVRQHLRRKSYDAVLDTQGLLKSALIARQARGEKLGYAGEVAREGWAARFYDRSFVIPPNAHAVERNRWLAAAAFDYALDWPLDYGIHAPTGAFSWLGEKPYVILLTATSRAEKLWDEADWGNAGQALAERGLLPVLPWGSEAERQRAERIAAGIESAVVAPPLSLRELAALLADARLCIGVDTGLVHLSTALKTPTIALYVATDPALTGVLGTSFARNLGAKGQPPRVGELLALTEQALRQCPA